MRRSKRLCGAPAPSSPQAHQQTLGNNEAGCRLLELPGELLGLVISHVEPCDLLRLGMCCEQLYELCLNSPRSLHGRVIMTSGEGHDPGDKNVDSAIARLTFVVLRPHLAKVMTEAHLHTAVGATGKSEALLTQLGRLLRLKPPLRKLAIHGEMFGYEMTPVLVDLMFGTPLDELSLCAIAFPRNQGVPKQRSSKKRALSRSSPRVLQRLSLVASHTNFLLRALSENEKVECLELGHMHSGMPTRADWGDCELLHKISGLVAGVHATTWVVELLRLYLERNSTPLALDYLALHELVTPHELDIFVRAVGASRQLKTLAFMVPADVNDLMVSRIAELAPQIEHLLLSLDYLGIEPNAEARQWQVSTRRGSHTMSMPADIETWHDVVRQLLQSVTPARFPNLKTIALRRPGMMGFRSSPPDAEAVAELFELAWTKLPTLQRGVELWRCEGSRKGVDRISASLDADLEYNSGMITTVKREWRSKTDIRVVTDIEEGMSDPLVRSFPNELPTFSIGEM